MASKATDQVTKRGVNIGKSSFHLIAVGRLRVRNGPSATPSGRSAVGGEADVFRQKADIGQRMSAVRGKADVPVTWPGSPLLARSGHWALVVFREITQSRTS